MYKRLSGPIPVKTFYRPIDSYEKRNHFVEKIISRLLFGTRFSKTLSVVMALFLTIGTLSSQVVITEVFYNAPGVDTIEYIEFYNNSNNTIDLQGYNLSQGVTYTFPSIMLGANEYLVLANDSLAMVNILGVTAYQWTTGGLNNSGEDIQLNNSNGMFVDYVNYLDGGSWPDQADGLGYSMELCDPNKNNNDPVNWAISQTDTGVDLFLTSIFGTPGEPNTIPCANTVNIVGLTFTPANITIRVGETVEWVNATATNHNVNGTLATYPGNPEGFGNGAAAPNWTFSHTFNTPGVYDYRCDPHFGQNMVGTVTVLADDLVISEIMYNPPGSDALGEYIELYNKSNVAIDLTGYYFSQGVDYTFPSLSIAAGEYLVIASDSSSIDALYGITARQWTLGGLTNNGELIALNDPTGSLVDVVNYNNNSPWAEITNGEGPSLILCDADADNDDPANWSYSYENTGIVPPGSTDIIFASPGQPNTCPTSPQIFFNGISGTVNEGDMAGTFSVRMPILTDTDSADVDVVLHASSTATDVTDFSILSTTIHFAPDLPGEVSEAEIVIGLIDDLEIEGDETIVVQLMNASGASIVTGGLYTITIEDNDGLTASYPTYPISTVNTENNVDGIADSLGVVCSLTGIVHGVNMTQNLLSFTIIDQGNSGIGVFTDSSSFGYTVNEGDLVTIDGVIDQFRGLTQMSPDTIKFISGPNPLWNPNVVTALDESTESQMVRFNNMTLVDPTDWTNGGSGFNVDITDGSNTVTMRIDADTDIFGTPAPTGSFDVIGIGGQFDFSAPYDEGYQFFPRYMPDIMPLASVLTTQNDDVSTEIDEAVTISVLDNDITPFDILSVNILNQPAFGDAVVNGDLSITYTPDFGVCGPDAFSYIACDNQTVCDTAFVTVNVECPASYPLYEIVNVTTTDSDGVPDSIGVTCELRGVVYGVNLQEGAGGLQFTIIDPNNSEAGIGVFSSSGNGTLGYTVNEGDQISVEGEITHFNGFAQINADVISMLSPGNALHDPAAVTSLGEDTESRLVKLFNVSIVDPTDWDNSNASGFNVDVTDGTSTWTVRIDNEVDLYNEPVPMGPLNITGLGGQFDSSVPHSEGYQLLPRYIADIELYVGTNDLDLKQQVHLFPNPAENTLFINSEIQLDGLQVYNKLGQLLMTKKSLSNNNSVDISALTPGMYVLVFEKDGYRWGEKFVKQ